MGQYQTIKTQAGLGLEAAAETGGPAIKLVSMSVGDGGGNATQPSSTQTALVHEVDRVDLNSLRQNSTDATQWVAEAVFPAEHGGYTVREVGLWTDGGVLFAVANFPDTYKPAPSEGTAGQYLISLNFRAQNSNNITLVVDGNLQLATINYVDEKTAAVSAAVQSESQRAEKAEAGMVSGISGLPSGGSAGVGLFSDATGQPQFTDGANGTRALALLSSVSGFATTTALSTAQTNLNNAISAETQRAEAAEAGLLPLSGGTLTGNVIGSAGGVVPQLLGQSGRVVIQSFLANTANGSSGAITFPVAFAPGTTPFVICGAVTELGTGKSSINEIFQNSDGSLQITNTGFNFYRTTGTSGSYYGQTIPVLAIGVV